MSPSRSVQAQILNLLLDLQQDLSVACIFITHDLGVVSQVCDRVAVMYGGRLLEVARTADLFARPNHPYTRALLAANPAGAPRQSRLPVIPAEWSVESLEQSERQKTPAQRPVEEVAHD